MLMRSPCCVRAATISAYVYLDCLRAQAAPCAPFALRPLAWHLLPSDHAKALFVYIDGDPSARKI